MTDTAPVAIGIDIAARAADIIINLDPDHPTHHRVPHADVTDTINATLPDDRPRTIGMEYTGGLALPILTALEQDPRNTLYIVNDTDTAALRTMLRRPRKTDKLDAELIARVMHLARDPASRAIINDHLTPWTALRPAVLARHAVRHLQALTRDRTRATLRRQRAQTALARAQLDTIITTYDGLIKSATADIVALARTDPNAQLLTTIPGIGLRRAAIILAAIGDINRFETPDKLVRYVGLNPPHRPTSNGTITGPPLRKRASDLLATELFMWSMAVAGHPERYAGWGETYARYAARNEKRRGQRTVQRKLIRTIWFMLTTQTAWDPERTYQHRHAATPNPMPDTEAVVASEGGGGCGPLPSVA